MSDQHDDGQRVLDFSDSPIANFDKKEEKIGRQVNVVYPVRTVYGETRRKQLSDDIGNRTKTFMEVGATGLIQSDKDAETLATIVAKLKYGARHAQYHDLGVGIYSALTRPHSDVQFYDVQHLRNNDGVIVKTAVTLSRPGLEKIAFGPLVDTNGRAVTGVGPVVKELRKSLHSVLYGLQPEPFAAASVHKKRDDGSDIDVVIHGRPVTVNNFTKDAFTIVLDNHFFPVMEVEGAGLKVKNELYIHQVAGLYGVWAFGRWLLHQQGSHKLPQAPDAHKTLLYLQAASELRTFAPEVIRRNGSGRYNFAFRRVPTVRELRPEAIHSGGYVRYKEFSRFIADVGQAYLTAINELGIINEMDPRTLVPATDRGSEFPEKFPEVVYIKADEVTQAIVDMT